MTATSDTVPTAAEKGVRCATSMAPSDIPAPTPPNVTARITVSERAVRPCSAKSVVRWYAGKGVRDSPVARPGRGSVRAVLTL